MGRRGRHSSVQGTEKKIWKIGEYIRLSRDDGNDESASVISQRKILDDFIISYFKDEYVIIDQYVDDGLTGTDDTRDSFVRMMEDAKSGKINCIVCKTLSRAFRNYADQGRYLEQIFPLLGLRFISVSNPHVDSYTDPEAISHGLEIPINGLMNDRYAAKTSADVRRTLDMKRRRGEFIGAFAPYGYRKDPENKNHLIIDDEAAETVRCIYKWFIEGMSKNGIAKRLNAEGIPNPTGYKRSKGLNVQNNSMKKHSDVWTGPTIAAILCNQMYIGHMVQGKQQVISYKIHETRRQPESEWFVVESTHEPIVSNGDFEKAQSLNNRNTRAAPGKSEAHLLAGFLRCADCDRALVRHRGEDTRNVYFRCGYNKRLGLCSSHSIREDKLIDAILEAIRSQVYLVYDMSETIANINKSPVKFAESSRVVKALQSQRQELERVMRKSDNLYVDYTDSLITREEYTRMKERFAEQASAIRSSIAALEAEQQNLRQGVNEADPYLEAFIRHKNITELTRPVLVELIDTVYLHKDKSITVVFKLADRHKQIAEYIQENTPQQKANYA